MKSKGSALIYVIIILVPVMALALALSELSFTDFKTSSNIINSQQAFYNAEAGIRYGIKKLQGTHFDGSYSGYNSSKDYVYDEGSNYSTTSINYNASTKIFKLKSTGYYNDFSRNKTLEIDKYSIINLRRKFSAENMIASNGRVNFKTLKALGSYVYLHNYERLLNFGEKEVNPSSNIYTFFKGEDISSAVKNTGSDLFQSDPSYISRAFKISTPSLERKEWKPYGTGVQYYVSGENEDTILNLEKIIEGSNNFLKDFRDLGGIINEEDKFVNSCARVLIIDGNLNISGIKGEFSPGVTNAERYFENLVIYCTGKITIDNCELFKFGENSDLNLSVIANEIEFISPEGSAGSIISCLKGNEGLIKDYENTIADLLQVNTNGEFICATGY